MIEKTVTTLFGNLVSIQGKYIDQAIKKSEWEHGYSMLSTTNTYKENYCAR